MSTSSDRHGTEPKRSFQLTTDSTPGKDFEARLNKDYGPGNEHYDDMCRLVKQGLKEGWVAETGESTERKRCRLSCG